MATVQTWCSGAEGARDDVDIKTEKGVAAGAVVSESELTDTIEVLKEILAEHSLDANYPQELLDRAREFLDRDPDSIQAFDAQALVDDIRRQKDLLLNDSPYPEVRAVVDPFDDPSVSANTFRAWFIGLLLTVVFTGVNQLFALRYPTIMIYSVVSQTVSYPIGAFLAKILPTKTFNFFGWSWSLNPGPFNQKEHMLITVMANVAYGGYLGTAYVTNIFTVLKVKKWYNMTALYDKAGFQILLALSTQLVGFGCAGLARRFLVYPATLIYPKALGTIALNKALHNDSKLTTVNGWTISRLKFLQWSFLVMFIYYWFPGYIFTALSTFNWITWISPTNVPLALITGSLGGLGVNPIPTFDWNVISVLYDPIITPFYSLVNSAIGATLACICVIVPIYWTNTWNTGYFSIITNGLSDSTGNSYNVSKILSNGKLDVAEYESYGPAYMSASYAIMFFCFFGLYMSGIVHVALYNRHQLYKGLKSFLKWGNAHDDHEDVHNRLMRSYKEVPEWWYVAILVITFVLGVINSEIYDTGFPVWGLAFAIALCLVLQIPYGIVYAITNAELTNNVIAEVIAGYAIPNQPVANMIFKSYGLLACAQAIQFSSDLKMGHYVKIAPRVMFSAQVISTIVGAFVAVGVNAWALANIPDVCTDHQSSKFTCLSRLPFFFSTLTF
jgi:OPT family small oligopeptide transporter